jgi:hypothetical protein
MNLVYSFKQSVEAVGKLTGNNHIVHYFRTPLLSGTSAAELLRKVRIYS